MGTTGGGEYQYTFGGPWEARTLRALHFEAHRTDRIGWLRAAVLGANDGIVSTASLVAGEYVSVSSQSDTEGADLNRERTDLTAIYVKRGLDDALAQQVAAQLMAHDALGAHSRDELGISDTASARPLQAALASAATFAVGAAMPLGMVLVAPSASLIPVVIVTSILFLALLGGLGAYAGGAPVMKAAFRVTFWGAAAMALTAGVGAMFGAAV